MRPRYHRWLRAAAVYNAAWGTAVVALGNSVAWKCVGMLVLCYAPGYWWASRRALPELVAVGLLGKILGPIGFVWALATGQLPLAFGATILTNDVLWWPAFVGYLREAGWLRRPRARASAPARNARG